MSDMLLPDFDQTIAFLDAYSGDDPIVLTAIVPDRGGIGLRTFRPRSQPDEIRSWLEGLSGKANLYFTVNPCLVALSGKGKKAKKTDIRALKALHVDIDPRVGEEFAEERARAVRVLQNFDPPASIVIDSGNGFQGFWLLDEEQPVDGLEERAVELERYSQHIALKLTADHCHNIDRIMRLPGTINLPDAKKREKGRVPVLASLFSVDWDRRYPLSRFVAAPLRRSVATTPAVTVTTPRILVGPVDLDGLPNTVSDQTKVVILHGHDPDAPNRLPSRSEWLFGVCCELVRTRVDDDVIAAIIMDPRFLISASVLEKKGKAADYAARQIRRAHEEANGGHRSNRPTVMLTESELPRVLDEVEAGLLAMDARLYQMAGRLVHVERRDGHTATRDGAAPGALIIKDITDHRLREYMIENIDFRRPKDDDGDASVSVPTLAHAKHLQARSDKWTFHPLRAVVEALTLCPDGSVIQTEGYDQTSGFYLDFGGTAFPPVPDNPTRDDALAALALLKEPITGFPFVVEPEIGPGASSSRSVALSAMLTALCRRALRSAPLHAFTAPTMATGKSLLADVVSIIATGRSATVVSQGKNEEEDEKRLLALLMPGEPIFVLDNVERPISGDAFASILTQEHWQSRMLGQSRQVQVATNVLIIATGNNLAFKGDMSTRAIVSRIDAGVEAPETRTFTGDLRKDVRARRPALAVAGLTILRAFHVAGRPGLSELKPFGRFEPWSELVRGALVWLDEADPCLSRTFVAQRDLARDEHGDLLEAWRETIGAGTVVRAAEVIERTMRSGGLKALGEAVASICPMGPNAKRLGHYLKAINGRWLNGLCIEQLPDPKQGARYRLKDQTQSEAPRQTELKL
ncbi:hypothetical protein [Oryzibacter oryziterrae]|uniref:hypothetical protein n=1 Tax=Oryzibacter oryziterrae TaxID=2766474 RepID=UPI001F3AD3A3|nr:hypothetical protein [Oryzibacter oryziterrae]